MAFFTLFQLIFIDPAVTLDAVYIIHIDYGYVEIHRRYKSLTKLLSFFYTLGAKKLFKSTDAFVLFCFVFRWRGEVNAGLVWSRTADTNSYTKIFLFFFFVWTKAAIYYVAVLRRFMVMTIHASCSGWQFQNRKKKLLAYLNQVRERESGSASY
jgi:hypothetical protein